MKRIAARVTSALLTFILGTTASSLLQPYRIPQSSPPHISISAPAIIAPPTMAVVTIPPGPDHETSVVFGGGLKLVSNKVQLKSELLRYEINVTYPQIDGTNALPIRKLNIHIERLVSKDYETWLNPSREDLRFYTQSHPEAFNSSSLDYEVILATDSFLSIYFEGFSYGIGAAHSVQYSFVINYDLNSNRLVKLSDIFRPGSGYLKFISESCIDQLSRTVYGAHVWKEEMAPVASNFESWNMTHDGIRFNFDACKVFGCSGGKQSVEIPFSALRPMMSIR